MNYFLYALIAVMAWAPLPFASSRPWSAILLALCAGVMLMGLAGFLCVRWNKIPALWPVGAPYRRIWVAGLCVVITLAWGFFGTVSWSPDFMHHPVWQSTRDLPSAPQGGAISIAPEMATESLIRMAGYVFYFFLAFILGRDSLRAQKLLLSFGMISACYAVYGLVIQAGGFEMILGYKKWAYQDVLTSTFVNKNSYATYAGMGVLVWMVLIWQRIMEFRTSSKSTLSWRLLMAKKLQYLGFMDVLYVLGFMAVLAALILTASRAGVGATLVASIVLAGAMFINRKSRAGHTALTAIFALLLLVGILYLAGDTLMFRSQYLGEAAELRLHVYDLTLRAIANNPWYGFGLGSFDSAFYFYRDTDVVGWWQHVHNDYLEMALELGVPVFLLWLTAIILMVSSALQGIWQRQRNGGFSILAFASSVLVGLHVLVDFSLHIPAVTASYAVILGLGVAQSWSHKPRRH